ncbi:MAG: tRNA lysidine(34) synthetase TilS, partial [Caldiserica bacterium]|nr:tRNA lysidine(34) synthetase TilS [Caldisericota bacterium]
FYPLGAPGRKKLKDFFIDKKIPLRERDRLPLVISGEEIVWVVGIEISHIFRVQKDTSRIISLTFD